MINETYNIVHAFALKMSPNLDERQVIHLSIPKPAQFSVKGRISGYPWFGFYPPSSVSEWPTKISEIGRTLMLKILHSKDIGTGAVGCISFPTKPGLTFQYSSTGISILMTRRSGWD